MGRVGLTAFLEASGEEVRLAHAQRWFGLALLTSGLGFGLLVVLFVALVEPSHQVVVIATFAGLALAGCALAWWAYYEYVRPRVKLESRAMQDHHASLPSELTHAPPAQPVLQPQHAWLLLPAAVLALLYPRVTLRMVAGVLAMWRATNSGTLPHEPPPR